MICIFIKLSLHIQTSNLTCMCACHTGSENPLCSVDKDRCLDTLGYMYSPSFGIRL